MCKCHDFLIFPTLFLFVCCGSKDWHQLLWSSIGMWLNKLYSVHCDSVRSTCPAEPLLMRKPFPKES